MRGKYCDLHTHSTRSDGEFSREEVIKMAIESNIRVLSITDHNIPFDDLDELQKKHPEIKLLNGAEVSTAYTVPDTGEMKEIHVVALDFRNTERFTKILAGNSFDSKDYVNSIIKKLRDAGLPAEFDYDSLKAEMKQEFISRMAIARKLTALKIVPDVENAFEEYIGDFGKRKAYVAPDVKKYIPLEKAVKEILCAGGIPILAHLYSYNLTEKQAKDLALYFKSCGGTAMETLYSTYSQAQREKLALLADDLGLAHSAASDFHGRGKKHSLDQKFPAEIYFKLMKKSD